MITIGIKPLSTNKIYYGSRYKTAEAKAFERKCEQLLEERAANLYETIPRVGDLELVARFYCSRMMDTSNCVKLFEDCIETHLKKNIPDFNDRRFAGHKISRVAVKKGQERIEFAIRQYRHEDYYVNIEA